MCTHRKLNLRRAFIKCVIGDQAAKSDCENVKLHLVLAT